MVCVRSGSSIRLPGGCSGNRRGTATQHQACVGSEPVHCGNEQGVWGGGDGGMWVRVLP